MTSKFKNWQVFCVFAAISLFVNFVAQWRSEHAISFSSEATRVSWALQNHRGFSDPYFAGPSGPTAQMAPFYPALHAAVCMIFGTAAGGWSAMVALTAFVWALQWTFAYDFLKFYSRANAGLAAGIAGVLIALPGRMFKWEAVFAACAIAAGACLTARLLAKPGNRIAVLFGIAAGASVLIVPTSAIVYFVWGVYFLWRGPSRPMIRVFAIAIALACAIVPIGLWTARNYETFGHLFFIRDDAGLAIGSSNLDCAEAVLVYNLASGCFATIHPTANLAALAHLREQGEFRFASGMMDDTVRWVRTHPARFATLTVERFAYFWFPIERSETGVFVNGILMSMATVLSFLSIRWRKSPGFVILASALIVFPLVYYLAQAEQRYRYPVYWMSISLAAVGIEMVLRRWTSARDSKRSNHALGVG